MCYDVVLRGELKCSRETSHRGAACVLGHTLQMTDKAHPWATAISARGEGRDPGEATAELFTSCTQIHAQTTNRLAECLSYDFSVNHTYLMPPVLRLSSLCSLDERRKIGYREMRCRAGQYRPCRPAASCAAPHHRIRRPQRQHPQKPNLPATRARDCQSLVQPAQCPPRRRGDEQRFRRRPSYQFSTLCQDVRRLMLWKRWRRYWFFLETKRQKRFWKLNCRRSESLSFGRLIALWRRARE